MKTSKTLIYSVTLIGLLSTFAQGATSTQLFFDDFTGTTLDTSLWYVYIDGLGYSHAPDVAGGLLYSDSYHTRIDSIPAFSAPEMGQSVIARASIRLAGEIQKFGFAPNPNARPGPITGYYFDTVEGQANTVRAIAWFQPVSGDFVTLLDVEIPVTWYEFHEFAIERTPSEVIFSIDGQEVARVADAFAGALPVGVWNDRSSLMQTDWVEVAGVPEPTGPVAYWSFDDESDPGHDDSGNGHNGVVNSGVSSISGMCGKALNFDGVNGYVNFGNSVGNFGTDDFSVVFWMKTDAIRGETVMSKRVFCGVHSFFEINMSEPITPLGKMFIEVYETSGNNNSFSSNQRIDDDQWHQVAIIRKGFDVNLYVDGGLDSSDNTGQIANVNNSASFILGTGPCVPPIADLFSFSGELDEVRIYDRALSQSEIQELAGTSEPGGPIADAGPDQTVTDSDDNGNEEVTLNGSGSYDPDGTIVSWVWTDDLGNTIPDGEIVSATLSVGVHTITLEVIDNYGTVSSPPDTVVITVNPNPLDCFPSCNADYNEWQSLGKPDSWCIPRQCKGDADGLLQGSPFMGYYYIGTNDRDFLILTWMVKEPPRGPGLAALTGYGYAADFDHRAAGSPYTGYYRVGATDLCILNKYFLVKEPAKGPGVSPDCNDCGSSHNGMEGPILSLQVDTGFGFVDPGDSIQLSSMNGEATIGIINSTSDLAKWYDAYVVITDGLGNGNWTGANWVYNNTAVPGWTYYGTTTVPGRDAWFVQVSNPIIGNGPEGISASVQYRQVGMGDVTISLYNEFYEEVDTVVITVASVPEPPESIDLEVTSEDITFVPLPGEPCQPVIISATIWNFGWTTAENVEVVFKDFDDIIGSVTIPAIPADDFNTVFIEHTWSEAGFRLVTVTADPNNDIIELDENNNSGSKVYQVGQVPQMDARIAISCSAPTGFPKGSVATINAEAIYDILVEGQPNYEYPVKGGSVSVEVFNPNGEPNDLLESFTDTDGRFSESFDVPGQVGDRFKVVITVTDGTLTETLEKWFDVIAFKDIWVRSNDITFSNSDPGVGETVTISATIHASSNNTYTEHDIPVTFYVYPPTSGSYQIGQTKIITQMAPGDSNTVSVTWSAPACGEYYIQVALEPGFSDDKNFNNWAIRRLPVCTTDPPTPPPTEPVEFDLWIYANDVNFSNENPDLGETITIEAFIHAKPDNTRTEPNVPVTFYAHHATGESYKIGRTLTIEEINPGDNQLVSTTWRNAAEGEYVIEVILGPDFSDDNNGNNQATRELTVGNRPPVAVCQDVTVEVDSSCQGLATPEDVDGGSFDPDGDLITLSLEPAGPYPLGQTAVTLTVSDGIESATCEAIVTVVDTTSPEIICPSGVILECPADTDPANTGSATATDNCDSSPDIIYTDSISGSCLMTIMRTWTATDASSNSSSCVQVITVVDTTPPAISNINAEPLLAAIGQTVTFWAGVLDDCDTDVDVEWNFGDSSEPSSSPSHAYEQPGIYTVTLTATDDCDNSTTDNIIVVVYDPSAGFTTGGGWFVPDSNSFIDGVGVTDTVSKANFGFIVKYKQGADNPDGKLEFQYKAGDIDLKSQDMEWLVVQSTTKVRFKGQATINGQGSYTFKVTAEDNGEPGTGDWFKIEIWMGPDVDTENGPPTPKHKAQGYLGGGNIQIHQK